MCGVCYMSGQGCPNSENHKNYHGGNNGGTGGGGLNDIITTSK